MRTTIPAVVLAAALLTACGTAQQGHLGSASHRVATTLPATTLPTTSEPIVVRLTNPLDLSLALEQSARKLMGMDDPSQADVSIHHLVS